MCLSIEAVRTYPEVQHQLLCGLDAKLLVCRAILPNCWRYLFQHKCVYILYEKITLKRVSFQISTLGDLIWLFKLCEFLSCLGNGGASRWKCGFPQCWYAEKVTESPVGVGQDHI